MAAEIAVVFDGADPAPNSVEGLRGAVEVLEAEVRAMRMSALATRSFELDGRDYGYHVANGNRTWDNERAVEIPVGWAAVQARESPETIIEVGNVLGHYFDINHRVLDLNERHRCVTWNEDILEFQPPFAPELVVTSRPSSTLATATVRAGQRSSGAR